MAKPAGRALIAAIVLFAGVFAACGGDDIEFGVTPTPSPTSTSPSGSTPLPTPTPTPAVVRYTVQEGDTLSSIADLFGVTVEALLAENNIADPNSLQVGQVLVIRGASTIPSSTAAPGPGPSDGPTQAPPDGQVSLLELVDKQHALPDGYVPPNMVAVTGNYVAPGYSASLQLPALDALIEMLDAAQLAGHDIRAVSAYRSYEDQAGIFNYWVSVLGFEEASRISAQAGYSEHQLGTTVDVGSSDFGWSLTEGFGATPAGQWLATNAPAYGYVLSYPEGAEAATGYAYEPWHFRYIGVDNAAAFEASVQTLNQYLAGLQ